MAKVGAGHDVLSMVFVKPVNTVCKIHGICNAIKYGTCNTSKCSIFKASNAVCGGRGRLYTYRYTVTTRMTSALRAILMFYNCEGKTE